MLGVARNAARKRGLENAPLARIAIGFNPHDALVVATHVVNVEAALAAVRAVKHDGVLSAGKRENGDLRERA